MSNTKLSKDVKRQYKSQMETLRAELGAEVFSFPDLRATVLMVPEFSGSKMVRVSVSVCSEDEEKFRKWVGISRVLDRYYYGGGIKIVRPQYAEVTAETLAEIATAS